MMVKDVQLENYSYSNYWLPTQLSHNSLSPWTFGLFSKVDLLSDLVKNELGDTEAKNRNSFIDEKHQSSKDDISQMINLGNYVQAINEITNILNERYPKILQNVLMDKSSYQLWFLRIAIYLKLRDVISIEDEIDKFIQYENQSPCDASAPEGNDQRNLIFSSIPFSLRILYAIFPAFKKEYEEAVMRMSTLHQDTLKVLEHILKNKSKHLTDTSDAESYEECLKLWEERYTMVQYNLITCHMLNHDYDSAFSILENIVQKDKYPDNSNHKINLILYLIRILIQCGNLILAQKFLVAMESCQEISPNNLGNLHLHKGYLSLMLNDYPNAILQFNRSYSLNHHNKFIAINNVALTLLYSGKLKEAIDSLEKGIEEDPTNMLHECVIYNLCSMYELRSSNNIYHKRLLLQKVARIKGDGFLSECFKLT